MKKLDKNGKPAHADFGASSSKRWLSCAGSIKLSEGMPNYESKYALEGTQAHECLEFLLKNHKRSDHALVIARKKYSSEMVEHCIESVDYIVEQLWYYKVYQNPKALYIETRIDSSAFTTKDQFSTLDVAIDASEHRTLIIADFKYGAGLAVEVEDNSQLIYYALAMLLKLGRKNFDKIVITVLQPRANHHSGLTIRTTTLTTDEVMEWGIKFKKGVKLAMSENAPLKSGDHCQFCLAKIKCPILRDQSFKDASIDFSPVKSEIKKLPKIDDIKDIGKLLTACENLEVFIKAVKERAYNDIKRGLPVSGHKLVEQRSNRNWNDPDKALRIAFKSLGEKALQPQKVLTPAQFEKKFKKHKNAMKFLNDNTSKKPGGITLVKSSDKRKSVSIIDADFSIVGENEYE